MQEARVSFTAHRSQRVSVVYPETPVLINLSLICISYTKEVHGILSNPFSEMKVGGQKPKEVG